VPACSTVPACASIIADEHAVGNGFAEQIGVCLELGQKTPHKIPQLGDDSYPRPVLHYGV